MYFIGVIVCFILGIVTAAIILRNDSCSKDLEIVIMVVVISMLLAMMWPLSIAGYLGVGLYYLTQDFIKRQKGAKNGKK